MNKTVIVFFILNFLSFSSTGSLFAQGALKAAGSNVKPGIPSVGISYTLEQLLALINTSNPNGTSNFILPTTNGKVMTHEQCWPSRGPLLTGSVSAGNVNFGGIVVNRAFVEANKELTVQLQADPLLIAFLTRENRLTDAGGISQQYGQILLYFVLTINGANYRFYLNDPFPGRIQGRAFPARAIIKKWNYTLAFRPS